MIQIIEKLSIKKVSNEVKYKLFKEISEKVVQATPSVDEFTSKQVLCSLIFILTSTYMI